MRERITIVVWNSKGQIFRPVHFRHWQRITDPFEICFEAKFQYTGQITHWGYVDNYSGKEHREVLSTVPYPGWFGGDLTINSSIIAGA